jgi:hypothetical protein
VSGSVNSGSGAFSGSLPTASVLDGSPFAPLTQLSSHSNNSSGSNSAIHLSSPTTSPNASNHSAPSNGNLVVFNNYGVNGSGNASKNTAEAFEGMSWLPATIPENVRIIVSVTGRVKLPQTSSDRSAESSKSSEENSKANIVICNVRGLQRVERSAMVEQFCQRFSFSFSQFHRSELISNSKTRYPFFLRTVLDDLNVLFKRRVLTTGKATSTYLNEWARHSSIAEALAKQMDNKQVEMSSHYDLKTALILARLMRRGSGMLELLFAAMLSKEKIDPNINVSPALLKEEEKGRLAESHKTFLETIAPLFFEVAFESERRMFFIHTLYWKVIDGKYLSDGGMETMKKYHVNIAQFLSNRLQMQTDLSTHKAFIIAEEMAHHFYLAEDWKNLAKLLSSNVFAETVRNRNYLSQWSFYWRELKKRNFDARKICGSDVLDRLSKVDESKRKQLLPVVESFAEYFEYVRDFDLAELMMDEIRKSIVAEKGEKSVEVARLLCRQARLFFRCGQSAAASQCYGQADLVFEALGANESLPEFVDYLQESAEVDCEDGKMSLAASKLARAISARKAAGVSPSSCSLVAYGYLELARVQSLMGSVDQALMSCKEGLQHLISALGETNPSVGLYLMHVASFQEMNGNFPEAVGQMEKAYSLICHTLGQRHPSAYSCASSLVMLHSSAGSVKGAQKWMKVMEQLKPSQ